MLTATLDGLVERFGLEGERLGEVVGRRGAQARARPRPHARGRARARKLAPETPAYDVQQACGTGLETVDRASRTRSRSGRSTSGSRAAWTPPPTRRSPSTRTCATSCSTSTARSRCPSRARDAHAAAAGAGRAGDPAQRRAAHRAVDGRARGADGARLGRHARRAGRAGRGVAPAHGRRLRARVLRRTCQPVPGARARPEPARGLVASRSWRSSSRCSAARTAR